MFKLLVCVQTGEEWRETVSIKAAGACNLHVATHGQPVDTFVVFSSIMSYRGCRGEHGSLQCPTCPHDYLSCQSAYLGKSYGGLKQSGSLLHIIAVTRAKQQNAISALCVGQLRVGCPYHTISCPVALA
jgi:hypothetical protein